MFGVNRLGEMPDSLLSSYAAWDRYVAQIWKALFKHIHCPKTGVVVEIAPGTSVKIAHALQALDFRGDIFLVEPFPKALDDIVDRYSMILPEARIRPLCTTLAESGSRLPVNADIVVGHHVLDDMIMSSGLDPAAQSELFSWVCQKKLEITPFFFERWQKLMASPSHLESIERQMSYDWLCFFESRRPKHLMLSQYPSLVLEVPEMRGLNQCASAVLQRLKVSFLSGGLIEASLQPILNEFEHYNYPLLGMEVLNAKNWFVAALDA